MGDHVPWERATNIQDGFYNRSGTKEMSHQGVSGTDGNTNGYEGKIRTPAFQGHCGHTRGGNPPPWFPQCNILVPWKALNRRHVTTDQCVKGSERNRRRLEEEEMRESA